MSMCVTCKPKKNSSPTDEMNNGRAKNIHFNREVEN